jgi:threonine aldolase
MAIKRTFASDNNAGVHPDILRAIAEANVGHVRGYGDDPFTERAVAAFREHFGQSVEVFFVFNGTGANVLSLGALMKPFEAVVCGARAHMSVDECAAPERFVGCKLLLVDSPDGKIAPAQVRSHLHGIGDQHHVQARVISITQATEYGTVYTVDETRALADLAHEHRMYLHVDGARISNAAAALGVGFRELIADAGVDVLSFGGTKNGLLGGEAVVFLDPGLARDFKFIRKQSMQLASKMRFIACQFEAFLSNDLWRRNAEHANRMARLLADGIASVPAIRVTQKVESNAVFATVPRPLIPVLQEHSFFYVWTEETDEVRWVTSFDTTEEDVEEFVEAVRVNSTGSGSDRVGPER